MTTNLQSLIVSAQRLPFLEQVELLRAISQSLSQSYQKKEKPLTTFWQSQSLDEIIEAQQTEPLQDISTLQLDFWSQEDTADAFIQYINEQRKEDGLRVP